MICGPPRAWLPQVAQPAEVGVSDGKGEAVAGVPLVGEGLWRCPHVQPERLDQFERLCVASRVSPCTQGLRKSCYLAVPSQSPFAAPGGSLLLVRPMHPILTVTFAELLFSILVIAPLKSIKSSVGFNTPFVSSATPRFLVFLKPPWVADFSPRAQSLMALLAHCSDVNVVPGVCGPASHTSRPAPSVSCSFRSEVLDVLHKSSGRGEGDLPPLRVTSWTAQDAA